MNDKELYEKFIALCREKLEDNILNFEENNKEKIILAQKETMLELIENDHDPSQLLNVYVKSQIFNYNHAIFNQLH